VERRIAPILLAVAAVASFALLIAWDSRLTFIADDWELLVVRHGWGASYFLDSFHGNVVLAPALVYKVMRELFGMGSATPYYVVAVATFVASAGLLYVYVRRRVGDWLALCVAALVLFLGAAFEDLFWAFQIGYFGSVAAGLGMLIALDRGDDRGDGIACVLLAVSLAFSSVGIPFAAGAIADLVLGRRPWRRRAYVALLPVGLYALWWIGWGHSGEQHVSAHNLLTTPKFVFQAAGAGITSLLGLATGDGSEPSQPHLIWGELILVAGLGLGGWQLYRGRRISRGLAVALAVGLGFWIAAGANRDIGRLPTSSRYQFPSGVFLLLVAAEMARGLRVPRIALAAAAAVTGLAIAGGISLMHREYDQRWVPYADTLRSSLAALDIAGPAADPAYPVDFSPTNRATAGAYLAATRKYGSPAFSESELAERPQGERAAVDLRIAQVEGLRLHPPAAGQATAACQTLRATSAGETGLTLLHGGFTLANRTSGDVQVSLARFGDGFPVGLGPVAPAVKTALDIPVDRSRRPWTLGLIGDGPVRLCTTAAE
jgi:hypothetical protein